MLTLMPSAVKASTAGMPSRVAGTLIMTFGRPTNVPQMPGLGDRGCGVAGRAWRDFEADEPIQPIAVVVQRPEDIGRRLDVLDDEALDEGAIADVALRRQGPLQPSIVIAAAGNRLVEDGRIA